MPRRHHSRRPLFLLIPLVILVALVSFVVWFVSVSSPIDGKTTKPINVSISRGQSVTSIAKVLLEKKLIRSAVAFRLEVIRQNLTNKLQSGDFTLTQHMSLSQITTALTQSSNDRRVTLLEGWRREEIAQAIVDTFSTNNKDYSFRPDEFIRLTADLEGTLFPDTYSFSKTVTAQDVVDRLTKRFRDQVSGLSNHSGLTDAEALVLASIIEREAANDPERPVVAGVLMNRLRAGAALRVDASVQYAMASARCRLLTCDWWPQDITKADLAKPSPYNTYLNPGLPPMPISNPSLSSIQAAYNPSSTPYWFYLHDPKGTIHYATTLDEHNANVAKYLGK